MFQVLNISISHHQSFWYAHLFIFSYRFATKTALRITGVTESIPAVLRQRLFYTVEEFTSLSRGHVESKQRHRENMKTPHRKRAAVIDHWGIQPPKYNYNYNWWCRVPSRKWPGRGTKPTTLQSQGRRFITQPLSGNIGDLTNDFSSLVSELVAGAEDWETLTPLTPLSLQRQRLREHGEDGPWHHHQVGRWGVLRLSCGLRRGAQRRADRLPAVFRQPHPALLRRPGGVVHAQSHGLQLSHWMHHGNLFLFCFFTSAFGAAMLAPRHLTKGKINNFH